MVNIGNMMKQAQELQKKMSEAQEKLNSIEVEGVSGAGMVKVLATAKGNIKRIFIDDSLMSKEEKEITEDLIVAAINDAKEKGEQASQEEMKSVTGGIPLPPGMKLPF
jgi:DNA-binding YbaB/EbfC family protein